MAQLKRLGLVLLMLILLVSSVSAMDWDNVKSYDRSVGRYGSISIENALGFGSTLATYTLEENTQYCITDCYAIGTVTIYDEDILFDDILFTDFKGEEQGIDYTLYIQNSREVEETYPDYTEVCSTGKSPTNGSAYSHSDSCTSSKSGEKTTSYIEYYWEEYDGSELSMGEYTWRIEGSKTFGISVDWIVEAYGVELDEWAWWSSDYDFKRAIYANTSSGTEDIVFPVNGTGKFLGSEGACWINATLGPLNDIVAYAYYNNDTSYTFVDASESYEIPFWCENGTSGRGQLNNSVNLLYDNDTVSYAWHFGDNTASAQDLVRGLNISSYPTAIPRVESPLGYGADLESTGVQFFRFNGYIQNDNGFAIESCFKKESDAGSGSMFIADTDDDSGLYFSESGVGNSILYALIRMSGGNVNPTYATGSLVGSWHCAALNFDTTTDNGTLYLDGVPVASDTSSGTVTFGAATSAIGMRGDYTGTNSFDGILEYVIIHNESKSSDYYARAYEDFRSSLGPEEDAGITINITEPLNITYNIGPSTLNFTYENLTAPISSCWYSDDAGVTNSSPIDAPVNFTGLTANIGSNHWIAYCNQTDGKEGSNEVLFEYAIAPPIVNITNPQNISYSKNITSLNYTVTQQTFPLNTCWYNKLEEGSYNSTPVAAGTLWNNIKSYEGTNTWNVLCNDNMGYEAFDTVTFNREYNLSAYANQSNSSESEGGEITYELYLYLPNIMNNWGDTNASLIWNNTELTVSTYPSTDYIRFTNDLTIPLGTGSATGNNISWYFDYTIRNNTHILNSNSTTYQNTTIYTMDIDNCSAYTEKLFHYVVYDEETLERNLDNVTIELDMTISNAANTSLSWEYATTVNGQGNVTFLNVCVPSGSLNHSSFIVDAVVKYSADEHVVEYNYLDNYVLSGPTFQNISLYDLLTEDSTSFLVTYQDSNFLPIEGAIIDLWRYYVGEGLYRSVEHARTDEDGQTRLHFVTEDIKYKALVRVDNSLVYNSNEFLALCQTTPCLLNLREDEEIDSLNDYDSVANLEFEVIINEDTNKVEVTFATIDGSSTTLSTNVTKWDAYENNTICSNSLTGSGGFYVCDYGASIENSTYLVNIYKDGNWIYYDTFTISPDAQVIFGSTGPFMAFLLIMSLILMGVTNGIVLVVFTILGFIIAGLLTLINTGSIIATGSSIIWLIVAGGIIIWKIQSRRNN